MGATEIIKKPRQGPYDVTDYQTSHLCGGAIMGTNPGNSALNQIPPANLEACRTSSSRARPPSRKNAGYNPTEHGRRLRATGPARPSARNI